MMTSLPEPVPELEIMEMFTFADKDKDGKISWEEFLVMITPVRLQETKKPTLMKQQPTNTSTKTQEVVTDTMATQDTVAAPDTSKDVVKTEEQTQKEPVGEMLPVKVSPVDPVTTTPVIS